MNNTTNINIQNNYNLTAMDACQGGGNSRRSQGADQCDPLQMAMGMMNPMNALGGLLGGLFGGGSCGGGIGMAVGAVFSCH